MLKTVARTARRLGNPLEWSPVSKGILLCWGMMPVYGLYIAYCLAVLAFSTDGAFFNHRAVSWALTVLLLLTAGSLVIGAIGFRLRVHHPQAMAYQHLAVQFYAITMSLLGYQVGALSMVVGVVLSGSAVVGLILFDRRAVLAGMTSAMTIILGTALASAVGVLEYAPVIAPEKFGGETSLLWAISMILVFSGPHFLILLSLSSYVIYRWHKREAEVKHLAIIDPLTEVANRRWIVSELNRERERSQRHGAPLSVIMIDLDHFKQINDNFGHQVGDQVLRTAAMLLRETVRKIDLVGRYGGEEFIVILPNAGRRAASEVAERCRRHLAETAIVADGEESLAITASLGVGSNENSPSMDVDALIQQADRALYQAKATGRNQVVTADPAP